MEHNRWMLAANERVAVVLDRDGLVRPACFDEQIGHRRPVMHGDRVAVRSDGDGQRYFFGAASLAAAFFSALPCRTFARLASSTMSATDR